MKTLSIYRYKGHVHIGILGMIDDIVGVSENGVNATQLNAFINIKNAEKKLQFGHSKYNSLTIAHKSANYVKSYLVIDPCNRSEKHDKNDRLIETYEGNVKMSEVCEKK